MSHTNLLHYFFLLLSVFIVLTMAACGGADEKFDEDITNQFAPNRGGLPLPVMNQGTYVAPKIPPGGYPTFRWEGERPTSYNESPISAKLVKEGKIRHIGLSNETSWGVGKFLEISKLKKLPKIMSIQNAYLSLIHI